MDWVLKNNHFGQRRVIDDRCHFITALRLNITYFLEAKNEWRFHHEAKYSTLWIAEGRAALQ